MIGRDAPESSGRAAARGIAIMTLVAVTAFAAATVIGLTLLALMG